MRPMSYFEKSNIIGKALAVALCQDRLERSVMTAFSELNAVTLSNVLDNIVESLDTIAKAQADFERKMQETDWSEPKALAAAGNRIGAVKMVREALHMGLKEAVDLVDSWKA